jgi:sortase A
LKKRVSSRRLRAALRVAEVVLGLIGVTALGMYGLVTWQTHTFQKREKEYFAGLARSYKEPKGNFPPPSKSGDFIGQIDVPRIGISAVILEGSDDRALRLGVGHIPGTALPGDRGNIGLAGHRDTFFRALRKIRPSDEIRLSTIRDSYRYIVDWQKVVDPKDTAVLDDSDQQILTLVTCFPFYFVGSAPERFIVRAHRVPNREPARPISTPHRLPGRASFCSPLVASDGLDFGLLIPKNKRDASGFRSELGILDVL